MIEASQVTGVGQVVGDDPGLVVGNVLGLVRAGHVRKGPDALDVVLRSSRPTGHALTTGSSLAEAWSSI